VREEELAAQIAGINVVRYKMLALVISAIYAGVAGAFLAHYMTFIQPKMFSLIKSTELTIIVIFGGLGSISGSVLGAVVLTFLPEMLRAVDKWRLVAYGAAVILIMISRPAASWAAWNLRRTAYGRSSPSARPKRPPPKERTVNETVPISSR
jgi:branched-chain amino acid transport system permease protein